MLSGHECKSSSKEAKTTRPSKKEHIEVPKPNSSAKKVAVVPMVVSTRISHLLLLENLEPKDVLVSAHEQSKSRSRSGLSGSGATCNTRKTTRQKGLILVQIFPFQQKNFRRYVSYFKEKMQRKNSKLISLYLFQYNSILIYVMLMEKIYGFRSP